MGDVASNMVERYPKFWNKAHGCLHTHWVACNMLQSKSGWV
jgi:hypothetical protein